ncbi:hypothetical protein BASA83_001428 [Batrachochytrium salamandrivorans]|nr:hypothetical protein BASA83_001428 [Batrachochytrium salamandrivorans]
MQFFYLSSFVVAASYAVALPQPAGLSEKYSSNANTTLASGLEARSYQPGFNSKGDSVTLMSLKRRDDSEGSSEENSGSDSSPPPATTPKKTFSAPLTEDDVTTINLASTIDKFEDNVFNLFINGEKVGKKMNNHAGDLLAKYLRMSVYVSIALRNWAETSMHGILLTIEFGLGKEKYSKVGPTLTKRLEELSIEFNKGMDAVDDATKRILEDDGLVAKNIQDIKKAFDLVFNNRIMVLWLLIHKLKSFDVGKALEMKLDDIDQSCLRFFVKQNMLYDEIREEFGIEPPRFIFLKRTSLLRTPRPLNNGSPNPSNSE